MSKRFIYTFLLGILSFVAKAQMPGNSTFQFLNTNPSARTTALGGTAQAINDGDITLALYNPALLDKAVSNNLTLSYAGYLADISISNFAYAYHFGKWGTYAVGIQNISYGNFIESDASGNVMGTFKASESAYNLGWALPLDSAFTLGVNVKYISSNLYTYSSTGIATDIALLYNCKPLNFTATAIVRNLGKQLKNYDGVNEKSPLPLDVQIGLSKKLTKAPIRLSLFFIHLNKWDISNAKSTDFAGSSSFQSTTDTAKTDTGVFSDLFKELGILMPHLAPSVELLPSGPFTIRFGYNFLRANDFKYADLRSLLDGLTFGFGLRTSKFNISYGRAIYHSPFATNHFTFSINLSAFHSKKKKV